MQDLPQDVWELIAAFLTLDELTALVAVNRSFLNIALNKRYREVDWAYLDARLAKSLAHLIDSDVARRVKRLYIRGHLMQSLLWNKSEFDDPTPGIFGKLRGLITSFQEAPKNTENQISLLELEKRPRDIIRLMAQVITGMTSLRVLAIEWNNFSLNRDTQRVLESAKAATFSGTLHKLVLHTQFSQFTSTLCGTKLDGLEELELQFGDDYSATQDTVINIVPYISNLFPSLRSLKISSSAHLDHSHFFRALGHFPRLRSLSIQLPFDNIHLLDPSEINQMLRLHTYTLRHLEVLPEFLDEVDTSRNSTWPAFLEGCLLDLAQWPIELQSLTIPSTDLPTIISLVRLAANTLTTLRLVNRYLTYLEVADVVDLFSRRSSQLKHLFLDVTLATPNLINLLARKLPGLLSLTLVIQDATNTMHALLRTDPKGGDEIDWDLYDLSIFNKKFRDDSVFVASPLSFEFEEGLMYELSRLLPSVRSFKGRGHRNSVRVG